MEPPSPSAAEKRKFLSVAESPPIPAWSDHRKVVEVGVVYELTISHGNEPFQGRRVSIKRLTAMPDPKIQRIVCAKVATTFNCPPQKAKEKQVLMPVIADKKDWKNVHSPKALETN